MAGSVIHCRCSDALKDKIDEAAKRSHVSFSEQVRRTLEKVYEVTPEEPEIWFPPILREKDEQPDRDGHRRKGHA